MAVSLRGTCLIVCCLTFAGGCSLCAPQRADDGPVFEVTTDSIEAAVERHDVLVLLLYNGADANQSTVNSKRAFARTAGKILTLMNDPYSEFALLPSRASIATEVSAERDSVMLAQLDTAEHPLAAHRLGVHPAELPALRFVRGDASYGYKLRGPAGDFVTRTGLAVLDELKAERALASSAAASDGGDAMRVLGTLHSGASLCAFQQVAHAFRKADEPSAWPAVAFALQPESRGSGCALAAFSSPAVSPPPTVIPPASPPQAAPQAPQAPSALPPERVVLANAPAADPQHHSPTVALVMPPPPTATLTAQHLHAWVHWACLPKVAELRGPTEDAANTATFLRESVVGILWLADASEHARAEADRQLRALAQSLIEARLHGLTLLHASQSNPALEQLRAQLGLRSSASGGGAWPEFVIVRCAGSRFAGVHVLPEAVSPEAVHAFSWRFMEARDRPPLLLLLDGLHRRAAAALATAAESPASVPALLLGISIIAVLACAARWRRAVPRAKQE